jgi:SPP1 gp7 family putative phage head morphogenesis protein
MEDDLALRNMKDRLKDRLYNLTNSKVRDAITEKVKLALQEAIIKSSSAKEMKIALKKAYDDALWRFQQSVRTETTNNLVVANLLGYKEQGIKKVQWNPHHDARTCEKCRGMDGLEYEVDYLLSLGPYPLVAMTHYQCRCGISPVISHVEREKMITDLLSYKKKFPAPAKVSYPKNILKPVMTADGNTFKNVPLEYTKPIRTVSKKLGKIEHGDLFPKELEFVSDVADTAAFQKVYGKRDDLRNRVQYWKDKTGKVWVSNFYMTNKNPESAFLRIWAENIWSKVKEPWKKLYDKKMKPVLLPDLSVESATKMEASLEPVVAIPFRVGGVWGIALDKRFRTNNDDNVRTALKNLNLPDSDIETIVKWRNINPSWTMQGSSMEIGEKSLQEEGFVNETAKRSAKDMFTESVASFVGDGFLLDFRDPDSYKLLKKTIFKGREFK